MDYKEKAERLARSRRLHNMHSQGLVDLPREVTDNLSAWLDPDAPNRGATCRLAGPKRGDCYHFIGLPGESKPGEHDGPDDTVDCYGRPNGWCWVCWLSTENERLEGELSAAKRPPLIAEPPATPVRRFTLYAPDDREASERLTDAPKYLEAWVWTHGSTRWVLCLANDIPFEYESQGAVYLAEANSPPLPSGAEKEILEAFNMMGRRR